MGIVRQKVLERAPAAEGEPETAPLSVAGGGGDDADLKVSAKSATPKVSPPLAGSKIDVLIRNELSRDLVALEKKFDQDIRAAVVEHGRRDVMAELVGYVIRWHHMEIIRHQAKHRISYVGAWRGSGKTLVGEIVDALCEIVMDVNVRLIFGSRAAKNASDSLTTIKNILSTNQRFKYVFGELLGKRNSMSKANTEELIVLGRRSNVRGATIATVSPEGAVSSKHADVVYGDDLADDENSRTPLMRERLENFFWKTMWPILEPDVGKLRLFGTRYHDRDLYYSLGVPDALGCPSSKEDGLIGPERSLIIPALYKTADGQELSVWPGKFATEDLLKMKRSKPLAFATQYDQDVRTASSGGIVTLDMIQRFKLGKEPQGLPIFGGYDLAISLDVSADEFWGLFLRYDRVSRNVYVIDRVRGRFPFDQQKRLIVSTTRQYKVAMSLIESVQYQAALIGEVHRADHTLPIGKYRPDVDKRTRFIRLQPYFTGGNVYVADHLDDFVLQVVGFTGARGATDDGVDAFVAAMAAAHTGEKKPKREREPGIIGGL